MQLQIRKYLKLSVQKFNAPLFLFLIITILLASLYFYVSKPINYVNAEKVVTKTSSFSDLEAVPILLYHNIGQNGNFSVSEKKLRTQFLFFKKSKIEVISLQRFIEMQEKGEKPKKKSVVITVDDGYISAYSKLMPLAREFNYPITLFVYTDFIHDTSRQNMTWSKLRKMELNGFDIQSHTISHIDLTQLIKEGSNESLAKLQQELSLSKSTIEENLHKKVLYLAFPYGYYNPKLIEFSKKAGYTKVFSTDFGANVTSHKNFCYRRHHIKNNYTIKDIKKILTMH